MQITTIGIDLAKTVFQLHAVDTDAATVVRKRLRRAEMLSFVSGLAPCLNRHGSLRDIALLGARTRKVRAHREADASGLRKALCQAWKERRHGCGGDLRAVSRPNMRFVRQKRRPAGCSHAASHTALLIRQQTMLAKRIPGASCRVRDRGRARQSGMCGL